MSTTSSAATNEQQKIVNGFQKLRELQQNAISDLSKIQTEQREHMTVLKTVQTLEPDRKCFRQVGDTLFEFKASELTVVLEETIKRFRQRADELENQVVKIGEDINAYKEKHNIRFLSNKDVMELQKKQALSKISQLDLGSGVINQRD
uniref:Prefoldin subunit 6 n=1 Tax=Globodera pallida TaxID=36090 RepID=A0A183C473_GLOPA